MHFKGICGLKTELNYPFKMIDMLAGLQKTWFGPPPPPPCTSRTELYVAGYLTKVKLSRLPLNIAENKHLIALTIMYIRPL